MSDGMKLIMNKDGTFKEYDDTYDIVIHCESKEEHDRFIQKFNSMSWIPCSERLPEDYDNRFYMCVVENHEEDPPMYCQYEEEYGFGYWNDIYNPETLGFVDTEFRTNEELGYEKVVAWMPLPDPYNPERSNT